MKEKTTKSSITFFFNVVDMQNDAELDAKRACHKPKEARLHSALTE